MTAELKVSLKLPTFDGKEADYQAWWFKFMSYAQVYGFSELLVSQKPAALAQMANDKSHNDVTTEAGRLFKLNGIAFSQLVCAFTNGNAECNAMVKRARNDDWPAGATWLLIERLEKKYRGSNIMVEMELTRRLNGLKMSSKECPSVLFTQIVEIEVWYSSNVSIGRILPALITALPDKYKQLATDYSLKAAKNPSSDNILDELEEGLIALWRSFGGGTDAKSTKDKEDGVEINMTAFDGICYKCKQSGHKANKCPTKEKTPSFQGKCNLCGVKGHKKQDCWLDPSNATKRPQGWKPKTTTHKNGSSNEQQGVHVEFLMTAVQEPQLAAYDNARRRYTITVDEDFEVFETSNDHGTESNDPIMYCTSEHSCSLTIPETVESLTDPDIWLVDSGASVHSTPYDIGFIEQVVSDHSVVVGNGEALNSSKVGAIRGVWCTKAGEPYLSAKLGNVIHLERSKYNLLSLTQFLKNGWKINGDHDGITMMKDNCTINFDIKISTGRGILFAVYFKRIPGNEAAHSSIDINFFHKKIGHCNEDATRQTAHALNIDLTGTMKPCLPCTVAKAKQKNVVKYNPTHEIADPENLRLFLDIAWFKSPKGMPIITKRYWRMMVDERTQLKFSEFFETKDGMVTPTLAQLNTWSKAGFNVRYIRCDNAGENKLMQTEANGPVWKMGLAFEFTARDTPQHNHLVERGFYTISSKAKALMVDANIPMDMRYVLFRTAVITATYLDGLIVQCVDGHSATRFVHFFGRNPAWSNHLRTYGEAGTVKIKVDSTSKLADRGVQCMFVGYAKDHAGDVYLMYDPATKRVHTTRDVIWLKRMFFEKNKPKEIALEPPVLVVAGNQNDAADDDNDDDMHTMVQPSTTLVQDPTGATDTGMHSDEEVQNANAVSLDEDDEDSEGEDSFSEESSSLKSSEESSALKSSLYRTRSGRLVRPPKSADEMGMAEFDSILAEFSLVGAGIGGGFDHTTELKVLKYNEAMRGKDKSKWQEAIDEEYRRMIKNKVWRKVHRRSIPCGAKVITSTWAMKKKANGIHRTRLVARGYEQNEGEHFDSNFISSPVVSDVTIRIVLVLMIIYGWGAHVLDVNGAFLLGHFENGETIYMEIPQGFDRFYSKEDILLLERTLYGLKQAANSFWMELVECLVDMGFRRSSGDPCLYHKTNSSGHILIISWIDDLLIVGSETDIAVTKEQLKKRFDCDDIGPLKEYVGCKIERTSDRIKITQPVLIQSFEDEFDIENSAPSTPAEPGQVLLKATTGLLSPQQQHKYRSGVGKLLHLMRWSRPDVLNSVRELSKFMMEASPSHYKAMIRCMDYVISTGNKGLILKPLKQRIIEVVGVTDANYATDADSRKSVSGYSVFINNAPISFKSVQQKVVTLSTTEAELYAITQGAQEMLFVMKVIESIGQVIKKPMNLFCDNRGAIELTNNYSVGGRTRHVEVRQFFLRDLKELKIILCQWRSGREISSDMFTKNLDKATFEVHLPVYVGV